MTTRSKVMAVVSETVERQLDGLERQREQRQKAHAAMVSAAANDAQHALAVAEEEQAARSALTDAIRLLSEERGALEAKVAGVHELHRIAELAHSRELQV